MVDGTIERYKIWFVVNGFNQKGVNYHETFSLIVKFTTVQSIIALVDKNNWDIHHFDVNNVLLHGDLHEWVYMRFPP